MKTLNTLLVVLLAAASVSCRHKGLDDVAPAAENIKVVFDWRKSPDANPASMALYLFDTSTGDPLRYIFDNRDGGTIRAPYSTYVALCMNSDNTSWARQRHTDNADLFETATTDVGELPAQSIATRSIPRAEGTESERIAATPGMLWGSRSDDIMLDGAAAHSTITMYPDEAVCHYIVDVVNVRNMGTATGAAVDGTLSGMAEAYAHGKSEPTDVSATMAFTMQVNDTADGFHAEFLTFGECPHNTQRHMLTMYLILEDGTKWSYNYDVTSQVTDAPDPRHVHIIVNGPELPAPLATGSGIVPHVNDWQSVDVDLDMGTSR